MARPRVSSLAAVSTGVVGGVSSRNGNQAGSIATRLDDRPPSDSPATRPSPKPDAAFIAAPALASSRYNRQLLIPSISIQGQTRLSIAKVLIIGLGGLGSPAALYLAGSGIHTLGLLDDDSVELSNLHRQVVHRQSSVQQQMCKVTSAIRGCRELNSDINYVGYECRLSGQNACEIIEDYDIVLDCSDNPATRYLISDVCVLLGKVLISGAAQRLEGQMMVLNNPLASASTAGEVGQRRKTGGCYRCVFPRPPSPEMTRGCGEIGILGPVVGVIGTLMASEATRLIIQRDAEEERKPSMLLFNAWNQDPKGVFRSVGLRGWRQDCVSCGDESVLTEKGLTRITREEVRDGRMDYELFCGRVEDVKLLRDEARVGAENFLQTITTAADEQLVGNNKSPVVVDVREAYEVELGPKIRGSINIPISRILRTGTTTDRTNILASFLDEDQRVRPVYFVCQQGNDSQIAAQRLIEMDASNHAGQRWVGDVKGGFVELEKFAARRTGRGM